MIVKAISNKKNRDITINKFYPVIIKKDDDIRIVDDFSGLSIYEIQDFQVYKSNISSYVKDINSLIYELVDYTTFLEDYYNDDKEARDGVASSQLNILEEELNTEELIKLITSEIYSCDEKIIFIKAIENKMTDKSAKLLADYFLTKYEADPELLLPICILLSKYQNQEVYDLFLKYISDETIDNEFVQNIIVDYFNNYD